MKPEQDKSYPTFDRPSLRSQKRWTNSTRTSIRSGSGEISVKEAEAINKEAAKALSEARQKMRLMARTATLKRKLDTGK